MRQYLFGISKFCDDLLNDGVLSLKETGGLFDNDASKTGQMKYGLMIESPRYIESIEVIITMGDINRVKAIRQLLDLGYRQITLIQKSANGYERCHIDFSGYSYQQDKDHLVVLYLQHRSYSGVSAIEYMVHHEKVTIPLEFRVVTLTTESSQADYYYYAAAAAYFITECDGLNVFGKIIQLWHGFPLKTLGHMMKCFKTEGYKTSNRWRWFDHIASYGQLYTNFMCACYGTPASQYWTVGMPRNDLLFITNGKENLHKILPDSIGRKIVLYMPTFRELKHRKLSYTQIDGDEEAYLFYWKDFSVRRLEKFCEENNLYFVFKLHPGDASKVSTWYVDSHYIGIMTDEMLGKKCMYEYLNAADILVTDYSSVYFDYLLLNRPMIFTDKDIDTYAARRGLMLEPLEFWRPGAAVHEIEMLEKEITNLLNGKDFYTEKRKCLLSLVHRYKDGRSTERLFEMLKKGLEDDNV